MLYRKMFISIVLLLISSTTMKILLYPYNQLWASFFTSISAGCITGLIFMIYQNLKDREIKQLKNQTETHPQIFSQMIEIDAQFKKHQRAMLDAEGEEFHCHLKGVVKFANQYIREYSRLASAYPRWTGLKVK